MVDLNFSHTNMQNRGFENFAEKTQAKLLALQIFLPITTDEYKTSSSLPSPLLSYHFLCFFQNEQNNL